MARAFIEGQVEGPGGYGIAGARVYVYEDEAAENLADLFSAKTDGDAVPNPLTSDSLGRYEAYVEAPGVYYVRSVGVDGAATRVDTGRRVGAFTSQLRRANVQADPGDEASPEDVAAHLAETIEGGAHGGVSKALVDALGVDAATLEGQAPAQLLTTIVAAIVDSAPATLDTLNEIAAALNDDPNLAATLTNLIAAETAARESADADEATARADADALRLLVSAHTKALHDALGIDAATLEGLTAAELQSAIVAALVDAAPSTLDTFNEIAEALNDDPDFAATITALIGTKANDADVVHLAGAETITGAKTYNVPPLFKVGPWADVKAHGAVADGATDDQPAIEAAIAALPVWGGTVFFPAGVYVFADEIDVTRDNVRLLGEFGAILRPTGTEGVKGVHLGERVATSPRYSNVLIEGLTFEDLDPDAHEGLDQTHAIIVRNMDRVTVRDCKFINFGDEQIDVLNSDNVIVEGCRFEGGPSTSGAGGALSCGSLSSNVIFRNNYFVAGAQTLGNAIRVEGDAHGVLVEGNTVLNWPVDAIVVSVGAGPQTTNDVTVRGNFVGNSFDRAITVISSGGTFDNVLIEGNTVIGGDASGAGADEGAIHVATSLVTGLIVAHNLVDSWGAGATNKHGIVAPTGTVTGNFVRGTGRGIYLATAGEFAITNNTVRNCTVSGIQTSSAADYLLISGNNIRATVVGIETASGSDNNLILGNRISDCTAQGVRIRGVAYVLNNFFKSNGTAAQNVSGTGAFLVGNIFLSNTADTSGTWTTRRRNIGLTAGLDENQGAAAATADGGTITHGLRAAPTSVRCTPSVAGEMVSVTALGATTFTVAIKKHDGTAGTSQTIYWQAEV